jgi:hypothetical protein
LSLEGKNESGRKSREIEEPKKFCNPIFILHGESEAWADKVESLYGKG